MGLLLSLLPLIFLCASLTSGKNLPKIGVNYGQLANNLPSPVESVRLIQGLKAGRVKIYDANPKILHALKGTDLQVSIMVPNQLISNISTNQTLADLWVQTNVLPFYPQTLIRYLLVGNEILSSPDKKTWFDLVPAMRKIRRSLKTHNLPKVKVGTPMAMDVLQSSFPPSNGTFRPDISVPVMKPLLRFLNRTKSLFFLDVYTYFPWSTDPKSISLEYALLDETNITYRDPVSDLIYTNLLDQMLDAVVFAMSKLRYPDIRIFIAETGWPNAGDIDQIGANIYNAATYNRNLVKKLTAKPPLGTPVRPKVVYPAFIFSLYNENEKPGPATERHWGVKYPNESAVYELDLSGKVKEYDDQLPPPTNNEPYNGKIWCVAAEGANATGLGSALTWTCGQPNISCDPIQPGKPCYKPGPMVRASFAFSSYWAKYRSSGATCYFEGLAIQTTKDPSFGSCKFPSVTP